MSSADLNTTILQLKEQIAEHFNSSNWQDVGLLTDSTELINNHHRLLRSLSFGDDDHEGHVTQVLLDIVKKDPANLLAWSAGCRPARRTACSLGVPVAVLWRAVPADAQGLAIAVLVHRGGGVRDLNVIRSTQENPALFKGGGVSKNDVVLASAISGFQ